MAIRTPETAILQDSIRTTPNYAAEILLRRVREAKTQYRQRDIQQVVRSERKQVLARNYLTGLNPDVLAKPVPAEELPFAGKLTVALQRPRSEGQTLRFNPNSNLPLSGKLIENDTGETVPLSSQAQIVFSNAWDESAGEIISNVADTTEGIIEDAGDYVAKTGSGLNSVFDRTTGTLSLVAIAAIVLGVVIIAK